MCEKIFVIVETKLTLLISTPYNNYSVTIYCGILLDFFKKKKSLLINFTLQSGKLRNDGPMHAMHAPPKLTLSENNNFKILFIFHSNRVGPLYLACLLFYLFIYPDFVKIIFTPK